MVKEGEHHDSNGVSLESWERELLLLARQTIEVYVGTGMQLVAQPHNALLLEPAAVFVTLRTRSNKPGVPDELRGCVGQVEPVAPLYEAVQDAAIQAAVADPRFAPVTESELATLHIEISILSAKVLVHDLAEIEIGRDGLLIAGRSRRGLLLPSVATEYGWDQRSFVRGVEMKAGLPAGTWPERAQLYRFSTHHIVE